RRTADQTIEPTRKLLPEQIETPNLISADLLPQALDPAAHSLEEIRHGAAVGFEPVANSARRAVSMFLREPPDAERKGGL
ncbi:MAG: hypothetical protein ACJ8F7_14350, partial [Gemmataceae bacterium]